ncbi:hypothetical protein SAMN05660235_00542 [Sporolituus thermophilus DSM 23256]|uniref:Uncharacterized protein n=1 Tax=Sporolituus thermophilus DSM 23256 TaxID=1123285 RepID=A0A1G7IMZ9_9FIRM|nr:hypothetical protein SAMN05660235_00542 [Sporolituus thermophilus DSM 23256]
MPSQSAPTASTPTKSSPRFPLAPAKSITRCSQTATAILPGPTAYGAAILVPPTGQPLSLTPKDASATTRFTPARWAATLGKLSAPSREFNMAKPPAKASRPVGNRECQGYVVTYAWLVRSSILHLGIMPPQYICSGVLLYPLAGQSGQQYCSTNYSI